jgi:hypothetical protein
MAQPSGRVCAFDPTYRFYLRSSPILCAFDLLGLILRFLALLFKSCSLRRAAHLTMETHDIRTELDPIGVQALERIPFLRLIIAVLAMVQAIKLLGCGGIPWTLTWMYGYLIPYCVYEVLGIFGKSFQEDSLPIVEIDAGFESIEKWLGRLDDLLGWLAIALQLIVLVVVFHKWARPWGESEWATLAFTAVHVTIILVALLSVGVILLGTIFLAAVAVVSGSSRTAENWSKLVLGLIGIGLFFSFPYMIRFEQVTHLLMKLTSHIAPAETSIVLFALLFCESSLPVHLLASWRFTRKHVLLLQKEWFRGDERWEMAAVGSCSLFLFLLVFSLAGYALQFDPQSTYKPDWANVLG